MQQCCALLTLGLLHKDDLRVRAEVLTGQDHLLAPQHRAALHVLLLHHGQLVGRALGWGSNRAYRASHTPQTLTDRQPFWITEYVSMGCKHKSAVVLYVLYDRQAYYLQSFGNLDFIY